MKIWKLQINIFWTLCLLLFVFFSPAESAATNTTTKTPSKSSASTLECAKQDFAFVSQCCKSAPGNFFNLSSATACRNMGADGATKGIFREYKINRVQSTDKSVTLGNKGDPWKLSSNAFCYAECVFNNLSLIVDGAISYTKVSEQISSRVSNADWKTILTGTALTECETSVNSMIAADPLKSIKMARNSFKTCLSAPGLLVQCLLNKIYTSCPEADTITTSFCIKKREFFTTCNPF
ncbi:uncharacterized protein LOC132201146 [Neocloeon triangulifer]|uniref:uncharacterized protein LOC132201146 n=1 Tax=Neocloeon triangulifer TaxID=2078957 RepID=UPI00286F228C|nr:uncharacterized protein LOC132201146 [Neocloeon triangulifer]